MIRIRKTAAPRGYARPPRVIRLERKPVIPNVAAEVPEEPPRQLVLAPQWQPPPTLPPPPLELRRARIVRTQRVVDLDTARFYQSINRERVHYFSNKTVIPFERRNGAILLATSDPEEIRYLHGYSGLKTQIREISRKDYERLSSMEASPPVRVETPPCWIYWSTNATRPIPLTGNRFLNFSLAQNRNGAFTGYYLTLDPELAAEISRAIADDPCVREIDREELERLSGMVLQFPGEVFDAYEEAN